MNNIVITNNFIKKIIKIYIAQITNFSKQFDYPDFNWGCQVQHVLCHFMLLRIKRHWTVGQGTLNKLFTITEGTLYLTSIKYWCFFSRTTCLAGHTSVFLKEIRWNRPTHSSTLCWLRYLTTLWYYLRCKTYCLKKSTCHNKNQLVKMHYSTYSITLPVYS